jgi:hypothetical protein
MAICCEIRLVIKIVMTCNNFWVLEFYIGIIIIINPEGGNCVYIQTEQSSSVSPLLLISFKQIFLLVTTVYSNLHNPIISFLMMRTEMVLEVVANSPFNHMTQLLA